MDFVRHYEELEPKGALRSYVDCYWWSEVRGPEDCRHTHRVLPDGCLDILFDLAEGPRGNVVGAMSRALVVQHTGPRRIVAVRFRPGGAHGFFRHPLNEWTDGIVDLRDAWPQDDALADRLHAATYPRGAVRVLEKHLLHRLRASRPPDARLHGALLRLWRQPAMSVREMADRLGMTRQHLTRRCKGATGLGPKQLQRIARLQRALAAARRGPRSWGRIALDAGYCDQAHLIGECRALTGLTPVRLLA